MKIAVKLLFVTAFIAVSFTSCVKEVMPQQGDPDGAIVKLYIKTPGAGVPGTRAVAAEDIISNVNILVFYNKEGVFEFAYRAQAQNIVNNEGSTASFTVLLNSSPESIKLMLIANASEALQNYNPTFGESETSVRSGLTMGFTSKITSDLPMWGEVLLPGGLTAEGANLSTTMLRSMARIDVVKDLGSGSTALNLQDVRIFRANDLMQVAPDPATLSEGSLVVSGPSVPAGSSLSAGSILYNGKIDEGGGIESIRMIYVPEAESNTTDQREGVTSVIIGGYFGSDAQPSYYRVDINPEVEGGYPYGQILRNHRYILRIIDVQQRGWPTPEEAAHNSATNITVVIETWTDFVTDMVFDKDRHFGVSSRTITVGPQQNATGTMLVDTDVQSYTIEWADQLGNGLGNAVGLGSTITNDYFRVTTSADGTRIVFTALQSNEGSATARTDYILARADRLEVLLTVVQNTQYISSSREIRLLSPNTDLGYFGTMFTPAESRARGMKGILANTSNFGPNGMVPTDGFLFLDAPQDAMNNITNFALSQLDVIYLAYEPTISYISSATATRLVNWLAASPNRFLVVSSDGPAVNTNVLSAFNMAVSWAGSSTSNPYTLSTSDPSAIAYFTTDGPFTAGQTTVPPNFTLRIFDGAYGELLMTNTTFTPILMGPGGGMALAIDFNRRIVFLGDIDMFSTLGSGNRLPNETGDITNNVARLLANLWAYIAKTVINEPI